MSVSSQPPLPHYQQSDSLEFCFSANSTSVFTMVQDQKSLDKVFAKVAISETRPATVGLNDDIAGRDSEETSKRLAKWLEKQWSVKGSWER